MRIDMTATPARLQYVKGGAFNWPQKSDPNGFKCVYVGRPTPWGNPYKPARGESNRAECVEAFRRYVQARPTLLSRIRRELKGKNLACWCALDGQPCHADVLLEIANSAPPVPPSPVGLLKAALYSAFADYEAGELGKRDLLETFTGLLRD